MKNKKYTIEIPEDCSIPDIYKAATIAAGLHPDNVGNWDCRKILVSPDIYNAYTEYMKQTGQEISIGAMWLAYGPKVSETLGKSEVEIQDGFFTMKE